MFFLFIDSLQHWFIYPTFDSSPHQKRFGGNSRIVSDSMWTFFLNLNRTQHCNDQLKFKNIYFAINQATLQTEWIDKVKERETAHRAVNMTIAIRTRITKLIMRSIHSMHSFSIITQNTLTSNHKNICHTFRLWKPRNPSQNLFSLIFQEHITNNYTQPQLPTCFYRVISHLELISRFNPVLCQNSWLCHFTSQEPRQRKTLQHISFFLCWNFFIPKCKHNQIVSHCPTAQCTLAKKLTPTQSAIICIPTDNYME